MSTPRPHAFATCSVGRPFVGVLTATALFALVSAVPGQLQFSELKSLPPASDYTHTVAVADVDLDGDPDLVCGNSGQNRLYLNDGTGTFVDATALRMPPDSDNTLAVAFADVDRDGDPDLVCGNGYYYSGGQNRLYLNDGTGTFTDATAARLPSDSDTTGAVAVGDVDADGDADLIFGNGAQSGYGSYGSYGAQRNRLYLNDGSGVFADATATHMPGHLADTTSLALKDVDGDGDADLALGIFAYYDRGSCLVRQGGRNLLYLNDGIGHFVDVTSTHMPTFSEPTSALALGDVDGDGDADMVIANAEGFHAYCSVGGPRWGNFPNRLYLNDGTGRFSDATASGLPRQNYENTEAVALGDVDNDGDLDLVFGNGSTAPYFAPPIPGPTNLYVNDGSGTFADATVLRLSGDNHSARAVALADVDADADLDLVASHGEENRIYANLLRQLDVPFPIELGQPLELNVYARYGPARPMDVAVVMLSGGTARIPLPPFGTFALDPAQLLALPAFAIPQPDGVASISLPVPADPRLVGQSIYAQAFLVQALLVQNPVGAFLTNWTADVIMQ